MNVRMLEEVRRLLSVLLLQGHYSSARDVQSSLAAYQKEQKLALGSMEKDAESDSTQVVNPPLSTPPASSVTWRLAVLEPPESQCT